MSRCIDVELGELITQYELGQLTDEKNKLFEQHLKQCKFCRHELEEMAPVIAQILQHKDELINELHAEGISFETLRNRLLTSRQQEKKQLEKTETFFRRIFDNVFRARVLVPAAGVIVIAVLCALIYSPTGSNLEKLPYPLQPPYSGESELTLRDYTLIGGEQFFSKGISCYSSNDYKAAIENLLKAVAKDPTEGEWWLYLGVSYFLDDQPQPAINALTNADKFILPVFMPHAKWYLAQSYILKGNPDLAIPLLEWICDQKDNSIYASRAEVQLKNISKNKQ